MNERFQQPRSTNTGQRQIKVGQSTAILDLFTATLFRNNGVKDKAHTIANAGTYPFIIVE